MLFVGKYGEVITLIYSVGYVTSTQSFEGKSVYQLQIYNGMSCQSPQSLRVFLFF